MSQIAAVVQSVDAPSTTPPMPGSAVRVRNRPAVVVDVDPFVAQDSTQRLVQVVYGDGRKPVSERVLWGIEGHHVQRGDHLALAPAPTSPETFGSLVRLRRWTAPAPFPGMETGDAPADAPLAPLYAGVTPLPHQLVPLEQALSQPVVRLLIADDVGLGKTIEAGLLATELLVRRRIARILIITPPGLRRQWQEELWHRFALDFRIVDGPSTHHLADELGAEANPWRIYPRIITSPHYLRQPRVLDAFLQHDPSPASPHAPWDLLVVDEAHHLAPRPGGQETRLTVMLKAVAPWFEHRVFLTATPHDGRPATFTGLLEILDPVRFRKTASPSPAQRRRQRDVVIRRTRKRVAGRTGKPVVVEALPIRFSTPERDVMEHFAALRTRLERWASGSGRERGAGATLCLEVLSKRMLSSWPAFAVSLRAFGNGIRQPLGSNQLPGSLPDDEREVAERTWQTVATRLGRWLSRYYPEARGLFDELDAAVQRLSPGAPGSPDARRDAWLQWLQRALAAGEKVVVFTEYVATLDYLSDVLRSDPRVPNEQVASICGANSNRERARPIEQFVDGASRLRVLLCTDVLSEGLNLHQSAAMIFHIDIPWNPVVLQQRLGRLDRLGQTRQVTSCHFRSNALDELRLHRTVTGKVARIHEALGPGGQLLAPLPDGADRWSDRSLFDLPEMTTAEGGPMLCDRTRPRPTTDAGLAMQRTRLAAAPDSLRQVVSHRLAAEGLAASRSDSGDLALDSQSPLPALFRLLQGPTTNLAEPLRLSFGHHPRRLRDTIPVFPGHPLLRWLLARLELTVDPGGIPWVVRSVKPSQPAAPGILALVRESASTLGNPLLHQAMLPLWSPFVDRHEIALPGPCHIAPWERVERLLQGGGPVPDGWAVTEALTGQLAARLHDFALARQQALDDALKAYRKATFGRRLGLSKSRLKELISDQPNGARFALTRLEQQRQSGVLFDDLAKSLEERAAALRREVVDAEEQRDRLAEAVEHEARSTRIRIDAQTTPAAPLSLVCEGLIVVFPEDHHEP